MSDFKNDMNENLSSNPTDPTETNNNQTFTENQTPNNSNQNYYGQQPVNNGQNYYGQQPVNNGQNYYSQQPANNVQNYYGQQSGNNGQNYYGQQPVNDEQNYYSQQSGNNEQNYYSQQPSNNEQNYYSQQPANNVQNYYSQQPNNNQNYGGQQSDNNGQNYYGQQPNTNTSGYSASQPNVNNTQGYYSSQPNSTEQGYTEQQPLNNGNQDFMSHPYVDPTFNGNNVSLATMERKKTPKWIFGLVGGVAALAIIIVAAIFVLPNVSNTFALAMMSPDKYYAKIEKDNINDSIDSLTDYYSKALALAGTSSSGTSKNLVLSAELSELLTSKIGLSGKHNMSLDMAVSSKGGDGKCTGTIKYNNTDICTANIYIDSATQQVYMQIPELSDAYIKTSISTSAVASLPGSTIPADQLQDLITKSITPEFLNNVLKTYSSRVIDNVGKVTLQKGTEVTIGDVSSKYTKISVSLTQKDAFKMLAAVVNEAKNDANIKKLICTDLALVSESEYATTMDMASTALKSSASSLTDENIGTMYVWVDNKGDIKGREIVINADSDTISIGYNTSKDGDKNGISLWIKSNNQGLILADGTYTDSKNGANGNLKLTFNPDFNNSSSGVSAEILFENVKTVNKEKGYINGKFTLKSESLSGMEIVMDLQSTDSKQDIKFIVSMAGENFATINLNMSDTKFEDFQMPTSNIYDAETEMDLYMETADLESFITELDKKFPEFNMSDLIYGLTPPSDVPLDLGDSDNDLGDNDLGNNDLGDNDLGNNDLGNNDLDDNDLGNNDLYDSKYSDADYDKIMAAGIGSTGLKVYEEIDGKKLISSFEKIIKKTYGDSFQDKTTDMNNTIWNKGSDDELTYFETYNSWYSKESYLVYTQVTTDTVTNKLNSINISDTDKDRCIDLTLQALSLIEGKISDKEKDEILSAIEKDGYATFGSSFISSSNNGSSSYFMISKSW